jgi:hypothetical protein
MAVAGDRETGGMPAAASGRSDSDRCRFTIHRVTEVCSRRPVRAFLQ